MNNILSNAVKYTDIGSITIDVYCEHLYDNASTGGKTNLIIKVADTGKGMTKTQLAALYDEYSRFHEKEARFTQGTGLGMPIVYNLVRIMDGTVEIESELEVGTTVTINLPQKIASAKKLGRETADNMRHAESGILSGKQKMNFTPEPMPYGSVLVVDDVEANLYVARGLMNFYGLKIETVNSGRKAVEKIKSGEVYDIIFMDHMMPEMNGIETTQIIRRLGYTEPIVAFTANALIGQAEEFMKNGFDSFISKPIQAIHLNTILNKYIRDKQQVDILETAKAEAGPALDIENYYNDPDTSKAVRKDFLRTQRNVINEITGAVDAGDLSTAHRLAHTLKGLAGLLSEANLVEISQKVETAFKEGRVPKEWIGALKQEMENVLNKLQEQYKDEFSSNSNAHELDKDKAKELFDNLAGLLELERGTAMDLLDDLALIPHTEELIRQIEDFDFDIALQTLNNLRKTLEV